MMSLCSALREPMTHSSRFGRSGAPLRVMCKAQWSWVITSVFDFLGSIAAKTKEIGRPVASGAGRHSSPRSVVPKSQSGQGDRTNERNLRIS